MNLLKEKFTEYPRINFHCNLPPGSTFDQFKRENTIAKKMTDWLLHILSTETKRNYDTLKGFFVRHSDYLQEQWMEELGIPDLIFPKSEQNILDCFVKKYLMRGNTKWHFKAICNAYGFPCLVRTGDEFIKRFGQLPFTPPGGILPNKIVIVSVFGAQKIDFPIEFVFEFGAGDFLTKLINIYNAIIRVGGYVHINGVVQKDGVWEDDYDEALAGFIDLVGDKDFARVAKANGGNV